MYVTAIGLLLVCMRTLYRVYIVGRTFTVNNSNLGNIIGVIAHFKWINFNSRGANYNPSLLFLN